MLSAWFEGLNDYTLRFMDRRPTRIANASATYKIGKEGFGVKKLPFPSAPEKAVLSHKIPTFLVEPCKDRNGFFESKRSFLEHWKMGVFDPETLFARFWGFGPL